MALVVETGSGSSTAESYASVAEADAFHSARGNTAWAALTTAAKEEALRRGTDFMVRKYRPRWKGSRYTVGQALDWPRIYVYLDDVAGASNGSPTMLAFDVVPAEVKAACAELALRASTSDLAPDLERTQAKVKVGPLEVEYDPRAPEFTRFRTVEMLLRPFLKVGGGAMVALERS